MKVAPRDDIWSRGGVPVEELPDPFVPEMPQHDAEGAPVEEQPQPKRRRRWPLVLYSIGGLILVT